MIVLSPEISGSRMERAMRTDRWPQSARIFSPNSEWQLPDNTAVPSDARGWNELPEPASISQEPTTQPKRAAAATCTPGTEYWLP